MKTQKKFYWDEETLNYFKDQLVTKGYLSNSELWKFITFDCDLEDGETKEDLVNDLIKQIYNEN
ncbi:MAG: hypothetical protein GOVbin40013_2 [Prokaryotic dsDNA virus sp.]|jgi:hypothetical protein|nr:MAG: hypothetical protein GOVbin40013_2 [Prokaryotic dsDNA virus sp.]|tara:strand:+ start:3817 stop:4008 length:192 start_codon:yes stop_codon:yes gene_type:complete